jgi:uncharacterized protein YjiS (DUF1127 family)
MTTLTAENNRNTTPKFGELDFTAIEVARISHTAETMRAETMAKLVVAVYVNVEKFLRYAIIAPLGRFLARQRTMNELSRLSDRTLADIGIRRVDIATVTEDSYAIYMAENGGSRHAAAVTAVNPRTTGTTEYPANDDNAHRDVA